MFGPGRRTRGMRAVLVKTRLRGPAKTVEAQIFTAGGPGDRAPVGCVPASWCPGAHSRDFLRGRESSWLRPSQTLRSGCFQPYPRPRRGRRVVFLGVGFLQHRLPEGVGRVQGNPSGNSGSKLNGGKTPDGRSRRFRQPPRGMCARSHEARRGLMPTVSGDPLGKLSVVSSLF